MYFYDSASFSSKLCGEMFRLPALLSSLELSTKALIGGNRGRHMDASAPLLMFCEACSVASENLEQLAIGT